MKIGIDGSRAFIKNRTGIEEYSYQVIKNLRNKLRSAQVVLYLKHDQKVDFDLPDSWSIRKLWAPRLWTQLRLSLEILRHPVDVLFIPAHTVPIIHPKDTIVTIHGLEYEFCPGAYSWWERFYMRRVIKNSCKWAKKIIAVSNNTKKDLMKLYKMPDGKITVVYEGYDNQIQNSKLKVNYKYLLFIGRLEERKNIIGIIKAFEMLKEKYRIPHKLILAGKFGYGGKSIMNHISRMRHKNNIIFPGFVSEEKKWKLLKNADVFLFPAFYEGFGLPILEAQSAGTPVIAGNNSSIPEVARNSAILVNPGNIKEITDAAFRLISSAGLRSDIIRRGYENIRRFSWEKCGKQISEVLIG